MYKVVIVDDEPIIAFGIQFMIERYCPECRVAAIGTDGEDGFRKIRENRPDIVITDICMPETDGLELIGKLKEEDCPAHFIILSGYSDFNYARRAVSLGVEDYITKPVEEDELTEVIGRVCRKIDSERLSRRNDALMNEKLREYTLREVLSGGGLEREQKLCLLDNIGFPLSDASYCCLLIGKREDFSGQEGIREKLQRLTDTYLDFCRDSFLLMNVQQSSCILLVLDEHAKLSALNNRLEMYRYALMELTEKELSIGCSLIHVRADELTEAFEEARCAYNYRMLHESASVIYYEGISGVETQLERIDPELVHSLEEAVDSMDELRCRRALDALFFELEKIPNISLEQVRLLSLNILLTGIRKIPFVQFQINEYLGRNLFSLEGISKFESMEQLKNWILNVLKSMNELMLQEPAGERKDLISEIKSYIRNHFTEDISLKDISERFYINSSYFSTLFKKKTGQTYQNYLISLRISLARKLLGETDLRLYEICEMVGYRDINHFNRIFERETGKKPGEFRRSAQEGQ